MIKDTVNSILDEITALILNATGSDKIKISLPKISVQEIEIYNDLVTSVPFDLMSAYKRPFLNHFKKSKEIIYFSDGMESNARVYTCLALKGEKHKIYTKTQALIRFETTYQKYRIRSLNGSNQIDLTSYESIISSLKPLADRSHEVWGPILQIQSNKPNIQIILSLFFHLARNLSDENLFVVILTNLLNNGRICSTSGLYANIHRLNKIGILKRLSQGIYVLNMDYPGLNDEYSKLPGILKTEMPNKGSF